MTLPADMLEELEKIALQADKEKCLPTTAIFNALDKTAKPPKAAKHKIKQPADEGTSLTMPSDGGQETGAEAAEQNGLQAPLAGQSKSAGATFPRDALRRALSKTRMGSFSGSLKTYGKMEAHPAAISKVAGIRAGNPILNLRKAKKTGQLRARYFRKKS